MAARAFIPHAGRFSTHLDDDNLPVIEAADDPLDQHLSASAVFGADLDTEAETSYYLRSAIETLYPSVIFSLAQTATGQRQFCELMQAAMIAGTYPGRAETIAAEAAEGFNYDQALRADKAVALILLAAAQRKWPDPDWIAARSLCKRVHAVNGFSEADE